MNKFNLGKVRGEDGKSATIAIGTVRTGQAGSNASVNNVGDSTRAIFDFTIPRGDRGNEAYSAGSNVQISGGVISATDTTYAPATPTADGLLSKADKVRIDDALTASNNLSDLENASSARQNLGLGTAATRADDYFATAEQVGDISSALDAINGEVI